MFITFYFSFISKFIVWYRARHQTRCYFLMHVLGSGRFALASSISLRKEKVWLSTIPWKQISFVLWEPKPYLVYLQWSIVKASSTYHTEAVFWCKFQIDTLKKYPICHFCTYVSHWGKVLNTRIHLRDPLGPEKRNLRKGDLSMK